jgi:hypothetical protein
MLTRDSWVDKANPALPCVDKGLTAFLLFLSLFKDGLFWAMC